MRGRATSAGDDAVQLFRALAGETVVPACSDHFSWSFVTLPSHLAMDDCIYSIQLHCFRLLAAQILPDRCHNAHVQTPIRLLSTTGRAPISILQARLVVLTYDFFKYILLLSCCSSRITMIKLIAIYYVSTMILINFRFLTFLLTKHIVSRTGLQDVHHSRFYMNTYCTPI